MNDQITESISYEKGYLKGFHDGRKWKGEKPEIRRKDIVDKWNDFCDKNIPKDIPIDQQWKKMKECWSNYEYECKINFKGDWKKIASGALSSTSHKLLKSEMSLEEAIELFHDIKTWLKNIENGTTRKRV